MSNKTQLQTNNINLNAYGNRIDALIDIVNSLPDASEGGNVSLPSLTSPATTDNILSGKEAIDDSGNKITGTMVDNGDINATFDGINTTSYTVPSGYTSGGTVSLTDDIPNEVAAQAELIAQIQTILAEKAAYNTIYIGGTEPSSDFGENGDIYIVRGEG